MEEQINSPKKNAEWMKALIFSMIQWIIPGTQRSIDVIGSLPCRSSESKGIYCDLSQWQRLADVNWLSHFVYSVYLLCQMLLCDTEMILLNTHPLLHVLPHASVQHSLCPLTNLLLSRLLTSWSAHSSLSRQFYVYFALRSLLSIFTVDNQVHCPRLCPLWGFPSPLTFKTTLEQGCGQLPPILSWHLQSEPIHP